MKGLRSARLVARREIVERGRDRTFLAGVAVSVLVVAAVVVVSAVLSGDDRFTIAVLRGDEESARIATSAARSLEATGAELEVQRVASIQAARAEVEDDEADAALLGGVQVLVEDGLDGRLAQALDFGVLDATAAVRLERAGAADGMRRVTLDPPPLVVRSIDADGDRAASVAFVAALVLYGQLLTFGIWVASGIAEEKGSRVVELLLSATRSTALLAGKVAGIGALGFAQLLLIAGVGLALAAGLDVMALDEVALRAVAVTLAFFVLGYALYAAMFAVAGSLVSRPEDAQSAASPLTLILVASFFLALQAMQDPASPVAEIAALVPLSSPVVMPSRLIAGDAGAGEAVIAVALLAACAAALLALAARVYDRAVLRTGGRVPLREALAGRR